MRIWPFLVLLLAGCAAEPPPQATGSVEVYQRVSLGPQQMQLVYSGVQRVLSDPASAQFGQIVARSCKHPASADFLEKSEVNREAANC